jgi:hypothetical protein
MNEPTPVRNPARAKPCKTLRGFRAVIPSNSMTIAGLCRVSRQLHKTLYYTFFYIHIFTFF